MANFIEFPVFDGVSRDLRQWIAWLEDFFVRERFTGDEKMNLAQSLLEGEANAWFYSSRKHFSFQSWEHLVVELLLWRFGYFGDGGVFSDLELFLLWNKYDRIVRKRRKRMETTSITPQESISSPATIPETVPIDNFSNQQVDEISGEKKDESHEATLVKVLDNLEEASVTQNQVPVSKLEPSLQIPKDWPNVCENSQAVVGCEHQRSFQKNIRMDVVNGVVERSQRVMSITKTVSAHQVLDKTSAHKERLKPKSKRKLSLSLKTWRFKFKHTSKKRKSLDVKFFPVEEIVAGCEKKLFDRFQTSPSYALDVVNKTSKPWETHKTFTSTHVASVNSLSFAVSTTDNFELCVGHGKGIMRLKLLLHSGFDGDKLTELDFHIGASNSWCGWMVFDRGRNNIISGDVIALVFLALKKCIFQGAAKRDVQMMLLVKANDAHMDSLMCGDVPFFLKHKWRFKYNGIEEAVDIAQVTLLLQLFLDNLRSHVWHKWKSKPVTECKTSDAIFQLVLERSVSHDCLLGSLWAKKNVSWLEVICVLAECMMHTTTVISAKLYSLFSFEVDTEENISSGLSQTSQVWEPGGVLADHVLEDNVEAGSKGLAYAGCVLLGMNCAGLGSGKEELLATGQQMQRTDLFSELTCSHNKKQMLGYKTRMFKYKSSLRITRSASRDMNQFVGFMKFQLKHKWRSKHLHTISALGFYLSSVFSTVPSATSGRLQGLLEQVLQKDDEAYPQILDKLQLNLKQGMDVHGASGLRLFLCQQKFSSIWHRWRRKDSDLEVQLKERALVQSSVSPRLLDEAVWIPEVGCRELLVKWQDHDASENFWMFSKDFVQLYPSSKLEDKLVFEGGSIDTIKQSYYRKKKPWVETEGFSCKEALEGNGGFAVSLEV